jgi:DNA polymerase III, delta subunit
MHAGLERLASAGRLYASLILHGGSQEERLAIAVRLARALLCTGELQGAPGCDCRHCRRIEVPRPGAGADSGSSRGQVFHPDVVFLWQDLRTVTSADATRQMLRAAQVHPFEARGQVFVVVNAETLSDEAANVLLKMLEEPPRSAPRNFLLLTPAGDRLLPTVRSRSLAVYLGAVERPDPGQVTEVAAAFARAVDAFAASGSAIHLLAAADALLQGADWDDARDARPFALAASAVMEAYRGGRDRGSSAPREALLAVAEDLLLAPETRSRSISAQRILEGLLSKHLAPAFAAR